MSSSSSTAPDRNIINVRIRTAWQWLMMHQRWAPANVITHLRGTTCVQQVVGKVITGWATTSFSRKILLFGINKTWAFPMPNIKLMEDISLCFKHIQLNPSRNSPTQPLALFKCSSMFRPVKVIIRLYYRYCNGGLMMVFTDRNMWLYLNKDKWLCLTDTWRDTLNFPLPLKTYNAT